MLLIFIFYIIDTLKIHLAMLHFYYVNKDIHLLNMVSPIAIDASCILIEDTVVVPHDIKSFA